MNSNEYWAKREEEALQHYIADEKEYDKRVKRIYNNMLDACQDEIDAFYGRYASKEGITIAEAKKRVSKLDIAAYERKAEKYVKEKNFSDRANAEMRLYNATMKINRLEMLKANIGRELVAGHDKLDKYMGKILQGRTEDELQRQAGILGKTVLNNAKKAHTIPNASFHNATFSDRIWMHQDLLKADLSKLLQSGLIQGKNPRVLAREIKKKFGVSTYNAERLMRTELSRVQTEAQRQSFIRNGFEDYEFIANSGCCEDCQRLNGQHFKVAKMMPSENAPPLHPNCRCSIAAWRDDAEYRAWLDYLDDGGSTAEWNAHGKAAWLKSQRTLAKTPKTNKIEISDADRKAVYDYMSAQSYIVNDKLRSGSALSETDQIFINNLDAALERMPEYEGILQRSLAFYSAESVARFIEQYKIGSTITYREYLSATKGEVYNPDGQVQIFIKNSKHGRDISALNEREQEVLYQRNSAFKVIEIKEIDGKYHVWLEEV